MPSHSSGDRRRTSKDDERAVDEDTPTVDADDDSETGPENDADERSGDDAEDEETGAPDAADDDEPDADVDEESTDEAEADDDEDDDEEPAEEADAEDDDDDDEERGPRRRRPPRTVVLGVAAVVLAGLAAWFGTQAHALRGEPTVRNVALTDNARTSQVKGQVADAVNSIFSYNYADIAKTERAAKRVLTGKAIQQYADMIADVHKEASKQKLVLTTTVTHSGVRMLQGDHAHVLIFADQRSTRTTKKQTTYAAAMFAVDVVRRDGHWRISNIDTLNIPKA